MLNNDTALILLLADRQREIEALRARVAELEPALDHRDEQHAGTLSDPDPAPPHTPPRVQNV